MKSGKGKMSKAVPAKSAAPSKAPYGGTSKNKSGKSC
jgi:hypothetical protein